MAILSEQAKECIRQYKYKSVDNSILSRYVCQPFWRWLLQFIPASIAPNTITFTGFAIITFNLATVAYYSPDLYTEAPRWVYLSCAIGLAAYQTLDALDGLQARKHGTGSPLGFIVDHAIDAMNCSLVGIILAASLKLGSHGWLSWILLWHMIIVFYYATWEEFHTDLLYLGYINGVTEGSAFVCLIHLISCFVGTSFWEQDYKTVFGLQSYAASLPSLPLNALIVYGIVPAAWITIAFNTYNVIKATREKKESLFKAFRRLVPIYVVLASATTWRYFRPEPFTTTYPYLTLIIFGMVSGYLLLVMLVKHVCKEHYSSMHGIMVPFVIYAIHVAAAHYFKTPILINDSFFVALSLAYVSAVYLRYTYSVFTEMTEFLGIYLFSVKKRPGLAGFEKKEKEEQENAAAAATASAKTSTITNGKEK